MVQHPEQQSVHLSRAEEAANWQARNHPESRQVDQVLSNIKTVTPNEQGILTFHYSGPKMILSVDCIELLTARLLEEGKVEKDKTHAEYFISEFSGKGAQPLSKNRELNTLLAGTRYFLIPIPNSAPV